MIRALLAAFIVLLPLLAAFSLPAQAQLICASFDYFAKYFSDNYGEKQRGAGLMSNGQLLVLLVSPSSTFTVLRVTPQGLACSLAVGEGWFEEPRGVPVSVPPAIPWSQLRWTWRTR